MFPIARFLLNPSQFCVVITLVYTYLYFNFIHQVLKKVYRFRARYYGYIHTHGALGAVKYPSCKPTVDPKRTQLFVDNSALSLNVEVQMDLFAICMLTSADPTNKSHDQYCDQWYVFSQPQSDLGPWGCHTRSLNQGLQ